jgi:hypothetical protein
VRWKVEGGRWLSCWGECTGARRVTFVKVRSTPNSLSASAALENPRGLGRKFLLSVREQCQLGAADQRLYCYLLLCGVMYRSSQLRGNCTCPPGSACYNRISCDLATWLQNRPVISEGTAFDVATPKPAFPPPPRDQRPSV